ncbi:Sirt2 [Drosophila busckii]|uniref:NAD-dependent protein deacetylase n=1 Tax=Drosophila busckii TaxID=30019 RepID=A0A0M4EQZ4_DROBS|nr:NAD-dependent protein deacetylase Sirt2 [Drosophila busckii]ALC47514.1 Sirt2 [Drosophila busckii]
MSDSDSDKNDKKDSDCTKSWRDCDSDGASSGDERSGILDSAAMEKIRQYFSQALNLSTNTNLNSDEAAVDKVISDLTFEGLCKHWREHGFKKIVTMVGAGISTSAGIPDFRSPDTGLYNNLKKYKLPNPTAIFDVQYFENHPQPFFELAKELYPGSFSPTPSHFFVRLLHEKGLLQRHYTQNIDTLDRLAGIPSEKIVEAHGSFYTNHCLNCSKEYDMAWMKAKIFTDELPKCEGCKGLVKPDIVFFGENLPRIFYDSPDIDFEECDLLIIMGTSLEVQPFASLIRRAGPRCIRLLINRDAVGRPSLASWLDSKDNALLYGTPENIRDVAFLGDCDAGVRELAEALGWGEDLQKLINEGKKADPLHVNETKSDVDKLESEPTKN